MERPTDQIFEFEGFRLDPKRRLLFRPGGEEVALTPKAFDTLYFLVRNQGKIVTKDDLLQGVWPDTIVEENSLSQNISALRRIFSEKPGDRRFIETVAGKGFRFIPSVGSVDEESLKGAEAVDVETDFARPRWSGSKSFIGGWAYVAGFVVLSVLLFSWFFLNSRKPENLRSIAVLPFKPLVAEDRNPALEWGMTDALIWKLSGADVSVTPLSSVRGYDSVYQDPAEAGRRLGVDAVLDGNLSVAENRIRVSTRLVRTSDGKQIWAGQFDDDFKGIFAVQDSISARVASELRVSLGGNDKKRYTENAEAYRLFLQGRFLSQKAQVVDIRNSISYFERALELDSSFVPAYVGLADAHRALVLIADAEPGEALRKAREAADRAISLDASYAEGHAVRAWIMFWYDWDWEGGEKEVKQALVLNPDSSDAHQFYAHLLSNTGRHEEALAEIQKAIQIEPLSLRANSFHGMFLYQARRYDEAIAQFQRVLDLDPNYRLALMFTARTLIEQGRFADAVRTARKARELAPLATDALAIEAYALAKAGRGGETRAILQGLTSESQRRYVSPYNLALIYASLGQSENALEFLEKAYTEKDIRMVFLGVEPKWDALRQEDRFSKLHSAMNLKLN